MAAAAAIVSHFPSSSPKSFSPKVNVIWKALSSGWTGFLYPPGQHHWLGFFCFETAHSYEPWVGWDHSVKKKVLWKESHRWHWRSVKRGSGHWMESCKKHKLGWGEHPLAPALFFFRQHLTWLCPPPQRGLQFLFWGLLLLLFFLLILPAPFYGRSGPLQWSLSQKQINSNERKPAGTIKGKDKLTLVTNQLKERAKIFSSCSQGKCYSGGLEYTEVNFWDHEYLACLLTETAFAYPNHVFPSSAIFFKSHLISQRGLLTFPQPQTSHCHVHVVDRVKCWQFLLSRLVYFQKLKYNRCTLHLRDKHKWPDISGKCLTMFKQTGQQGVILHCYYHFSKASSSVASLPLKKKKTLSGYCTLSLFMLPFSLSRNWSSSGVKVELDCHRLVEWRSSSSCLDINLAS